MGIANQSVTPGRTTLLNAVNILLENIGEQPINSLETEQIMDARVAERTLLEFHKEGQSKGWHWNTEFNFPFTKDGATNEIKIPANVIEFALDPYLHAGRYVQRGEKLYDTEKRTTQIESTVTEVKADVIFALSWDEAPEPFNRWVTIRSARVFADRILGSEALFKYTLRDEQDALALLERTEQQIDQPNILTGGRNYIPFQTFDPAYGLATRRISTAYRL